MLGGLVLPLEPGFPTYTTAHGQHPGPWLSCTDPGVHRWRDRPEPAVQLSEWRGERLAERTQGWELDATRLRILVLCPEDPRTSHREVGRGERWSGHGLERRGEGASIKRCAPSAWKPCTVTAGELDAEQAGPRGAKEPVRRGGSEGDELERRVEDDTGKGGPGGSQDALGCACVCECV